MLTPRFVPANRPPQYKHRLEDAVGVFEKLSLMEDCLAATAIVNDFLDKTSRQAGAAVAEIHLKDASS